MPAPPAVTCSGLTFAWPDGTAVFEDFSMVVSPVRPGLTTIEKSSKTVVPSGQVNVRPEQVTAGGAGMRGSLR